MHVRSPLLSLFVFAAMLSVCATIHAAPYPELEKELRELNGKIEATKQKIVDTKNFQTRDAQSEISYRKQNGKHMNRINAERDSLSGDYRKLQKQNDNLAAQINAVQSRQREIDGVQANVRSSILQACERLRDQIKTFPPGSAARAQLTITEFLRSEIISKSVENIEAIERLWQIYATLDEHAQSVDVYAGASPIQEIQGQVDFLQIGLAYNAFVNSNETYAALWIPTKDSVGGSWQSVKNPAYIHVLKKAIKIRQGNSVPELIEIPFQHKIAIDGLGNEGVQR